MAKRINILLVVLLLSGCDSPEIARTIACFKLEDGGNGCGIVTNEGKIYTWNTHD